MEWTRSETIGMSSISCVFCRGLGLRKTEKLGEERPCGCVLRSIFKACLHRYRHCIETAGKVRPVLYEFSGAPRGGRFYGRKYEEFVADFISISRRTLDEAQFAVLTLHFIQGEDWKSCSAKLGLSKGNFFHAVYAIQEKLGRAFRETAPYGIYPLDEYFSGTATRKVAVVTPPPDHCAPVLEMPKRGISAPGPLPRAEARKAGGTRKAA